MNVEEKLLSQLFQGFSDYGITAVIMYLGVKELLKMINKKAAGDQRQESRDKLIEIDTKVDVILDKLNEKA